MIRRLPAFTCSIAWVELKANSTCCLSCLFGIFLCFFFFQLTNRLGAICKIHTFSGRGRSQRKSIHRLFLWRHAIVWNCSRREEVSENHQIQAYILYGWFIISSLHYCNSVYVLFCLFLEIISKIIWTCIIAFFGLLIRKHVTQAICLNTMATCLE